MGRANQGSQVAHHRSEVAVDEVTTGGEQTRRRVVDTVCGGARLPKVVQQADPLARIALEKGSFQSFAENRVDLPREKCLELVVILAPCRLSEVAHSDVPALMRIPALHDVDELDVLIAQSVDSEGGMQPLQRRKPPEIEHQPRPHRQREAPTREIGNAAGRVLCADEDTEQLFP